MVLLLPLLAIPASFNNGAGESGIQFSPLPSGEGGAQRRVRVGARRALAVSMRSSFARHSGGSQQRSWSSRNPAPSRFPCMIAELSLALRASESPFFTPGILPSAATRPASLFAPLLRRSACAKKGNRKKHTPSSAPSGHPATAPCVALPPASMPSPALQVRERVPGVAERTSLCAQHPRAHRARAPSGFSSTRSPRHRGPVWAASCRRSSSSRLLLPGTVSMCADDLNDAVQGCTDSCTTGSVRGAEHRRVRRKKPEGARAGSARVGCEHRDVLSDNPAVPEKHRAVRFAGCESDRRVRCLAFLVTFWAMPKSNRLARRARRSFALRRETGARRWIPAFAGMTSYVSIFLEEDRETRNMCREAVK